MTRKKCKLSNKEALLKKKLREMEVENRSLKKEIHSLKQKNHLQKAVLDTVEEVNTILSEDAKGKSFLWTKQFPHNLEPKMSEKVQEALKKTHQSEDTRALLEKVSVATGNE